MTQRCPADDCLSLHPTEQSLAMHLFKSDDAAHGEWADYDETLREVFREDYTLADGAVPTFEDGADTVDDVEDDPDVEEPAPAADGGPRTPPEPEVPEPDPEPTVPDHLVPVEEFVENAESELPDDVTETEEWEEFADDLRDDPEGYVDVAASNVEAGEVTTTDA